MTTFTYQREYYDAITAGSLRSARATLPLVIDAARPQSALDVGCGIGAWLSVAGELGVRDLHGLDGDYVERDQLLIPAERFSATNLEQPFDLGRRFDLVMTLEVAEHLPASSADAFVASLARHADIVLFSAAIPRQGGENHVNEQWPEYWGALFDGHGYAAVDYLRPRLWRNPAVELWYAQNMLLFVRRKRLRDFPLLGQAASQPGAPLSLVHPKLYDIYRPWSSGCYANPFAGAAHAPVPLAAPEPEPPAIDAALPDERERVAGAPQLRDARRRFLQLVTECAQSRLVDNIDHLFDPIAHQLPDPSHTGDRMVEQLSVLDRCAALWRALGDEPSRELFLRLLAYRALGPAHVRLQLASDSYRQTVQRLVTTALERPGLVGVPGQPFEWQLHMFDFQRVGVPVRVVGSPLPLASTYAFSQYAYRDERIPARPQPGDVALDVGGCWGDTALWLSLSVGAGGRVHTVEPSPSNRKLLESNLRLNPLLAERVTVSDSPLAARAGERVWIPDVVAAGATLASEPAGNERPMVECVTNTVDDLVAIGAVERVDFLKVDVEGADLGVLEGAANVIRDQRPRLALAIYHRHDDFATIPGFVESLGVPYRWYLQCSTMTDVDTVAFGVPE